MEQIFELVIKGGDEVQRRIETIAKSLSQAKATAKALSDELDNPDGTVSARDLKDAYDQAQKSVVKYTAELSVARQAQTAMVKDAVSGANKQGESYTQLSRRLVNLRESWKDLTKEERENLQVGGAMLNQINKLDAELKDLDAGMGVHTRNVGNYKGAFSGLAGIVGNFAGGGTIGQVVGQLSGLSDTIEGIRDAGNEGDAVQMGGFLGGVSKATPYIAAAAAAVSFLSEGLEVAAKNEQELGKINRVFGLSVDFIGERAEATASRMGLTTKEYQLQASGLADLLKPMGMSTQMATKMSADYVDLAGKLAEWSNGTKTAAEVTEILRDAMLGETDSLAQLGIQIDADSIKAGLLAKGLGDLSGDARKAAEAQYILEEATRRSEDAISDADKSVKSATVQLNEAKAQYAEFGETVSRVWGNVSLAIVTEINSSLTYWKNVFNNLETYLDRVSGATANRERLDPKNTVAGQSQSFEDKEEAFAAQMEREEAEQKSAKAKRDKAAATERATKNAEAAKEAAKDRAAEAKRKQEQEAADKVREEQAEAERQLKLGEEFSTNRLSEALSKLQTVLGTIDPKNEKYVQTLKDIYEVESKLAEIEESRKLTERRISNPATEVARLDVPELKELKKVPVSWTVVKGDAVEDIAQQMQSEADAAIKEAAKIAKENQDRQGKIQGAIDTANAIAGAVDAVSDAQLSKDLSRLDKKHKAAIAGAKGNEALIAQINAKHERDREEAQKRAFERGKKIQIAQALIQGAQAVMTILATPTTIPEPFGTIYKVAQIGAVGVTTGAQISEIRSTDGGFRKGGFTGYGGLDEVAGVVHKNEVVISAEALQTPQGAMLGSQALALMGGRPIGTQAAAPDRMDELIKAIQTQEVILSMRSFDKAKAKQENVKKVTMS